jgi:hypothetical protein
MLSMLATLSGWQRRLCFLDIYDSYSGSLAMLDLLAGWLC